MADFSPNASHPVRLSTVDSGPDPHAGGPPGPPHAGDAHAGGCDESHLAAFAQCPLSYKLHHVDHLAPDVGDERRFGRVLHVALEDAVRQHVHAGRNAHLDPERAMVAYRRAWQASGLTEYGRFADGAALVARWVVREGVLLPHDVLAIAQPFELDLGGVRVRGCMDRVDRIGDDDAVRVRDYTSRRRPPSREDAHDSLRLALFDLAARQLWPWAKRVELGFDLLRHDVVVAIERTDAQREATREYILATVAQIERGAFEARPSPQCARCEHRAQCPAYADVRAGHRVHVGATAADLPAVAREREELATALKALGERKDALDDILRAELEQQPELLLEGRRYTLGVAMRRDYPLEAALAVLSEAGLPREQALAAVGAVDGGALKETLAELARSLPGHEVRALKARLDAVARCSPVTRLLTRQVEPPAASGQGGAR